MTAEATLSRRAFLRVSAAAGGGLLLALRLPGSEHERLEAPPLAEFAPNAFVRIAPDGRVTVLINKAEMGQGVSTSLAMALAEELDADWSQVGFAFAPAHPDYAHPGYGIQFTGGSTSTLGMTEPMRKAGAVARAMLVAAAAAQWGVPANECRTENGAVVHGSGKRAGYGALCEAAAGVAVPADVPLKPESEFRLIGKPLHRLDTPAKVAGTAVFGLDVYVPGVLTALVAHPPTFGGTVRSFDASAALQVEGVVAVHDVGSGVAVVARGFWAAKKGRDALRIDWDLGPHADLSTAALHADYRAMSRRPGLVARNDGDVATALREGERRLEADYELPYLAHAPMEPLNCVVDFRGDAAELWAGTQFQTVDQAAAAAALGLPPESVALHTTFLGGGFGRRANPASDYIVEACKIAKARAAAGQPAPIKLVWTREDDMRSGYYRPLWHSRMAAAVAGGAIRGWQHTIVGQSFIAGTSFEKFIIQDGIDQTSVEGADDLPYAIPNVRVELHTTKVPVPTLWWRSVGHSHTAFVVESFVDELADALGKDPLLLRRELLVGKDRHRAVLDLAAAEAGYGKPLADGHAHGMALHFSFKTYVAMVLEASVVDGWPRVHRVTCAVDCGRTINPDTVRAQLQGAVGFGLTAALYGAIEIEAGRVVQSNFHDYRMLRMHEMPAVDVHLLPSDEPSTGVGEPGVPPVAPALTNALFRLTKKRVRRLPIRAEDLG